MYKDDIICDVWANREAFMKKHAHDMNSMIQALMKRQENSGRTMVDRRVRQSGKSETDSVDVRR